MSLTELPSLLRDEPGLTRALGDPSARIAVVEVARPMAIAALAQLSGRRPLVVACPTGASAGQLFDDLTQFMPEGDVAHFPAWETLPFERVSPSVETMGQRLEVLWRLRNPDHTPAIVVAGVRALLQKLGPGATTTEPIVVRPNAIVDPDELTETLVEFGYRREELVEHRGEFARRGAIVDVYPSTANAPIRIDLWGDEVDRLTRFGVNDQRSTVDLDEVMIFPARELTPTDDVSRRADELIAAEPWGREQWERLAEGLHFDGMESWLPWLVDEDRLLTDVLPPHAKVVLVEPRRMRDRATELLAEEDDLAKALASTWARDPDKTFPRLHASPDALLASSGSFWTIDSTPESPETPVVEASGWGPVGGDASGLTTRLGELLAQQIPRHRRRRRRGLGAAPARAAARPRPRPPRRDDGNVRDHPARRPRRRRPAAPRLHAAERQGGDRRRVRPHRPATFAPHGPPAAARERALLRGPQGRQLRRAPPARRREVRGHGQAHDRRHRARLPAHRLQGRRQAVRAVRPDRHAAPVRRRRDADAAPSRRQRLRQGQEPGPVSGSRDRPRARRALPEAGPQRRPLVRPRHAMAARDGGSVPVRRDARPAGGDRRREERHGAARTRWTAWCAATSGSARRRSRSGPRSRRSRRASRSPSSRRRRCSPTSTATRSPIASPGTRSASRCCPGSSPTPRPRR